VRHKVSGERGPKQFPEMPDNFNATASLQADSFLQFQRSSSMQSSKAQKSKSMPNGNLAAKPQAVNKPWAVTKTPVKRSIPDRFLADLGSSSSDPYTCVMAGSAIMLASGETKAIESFQGGEQVMTLSGVAKVVRLETTFLGTSRRIIELCGNEDECPLYLSDDHPLWTRFSADDEWWGTYNYNHYLFEKSVGAGSNLKRDAVVLRPDITYFHAHVEGWKRGRPTYFNLPADTPLYHLAVDSGASYIANGFVVISHCTDEDVKGVTWRGLTSNKSSSIVA
jgi:hypothetical protein